MDDNIQQISTTVLVNIMQFVPSVPPPPVVSAFHTPGPNPYPICNTYTSIYLICKKKYMV
jgi:hypothetical protein